MSESQVFYELPSSFYGKPVIMPAYNEALQENMKQVIKQAFTPLYPSPVQEKSVLSDAQKKALMGDAKRKVAAEKIRPIEAYNEMVRQIRETSTGEQIIEFKKSRSVEKSTFLAQEPVMDKKVEHEIITILAPDLSPTITAKKAKKKKHVVRKPSKALDIKELEAWLDGPGIVKPALNPYSISEEMEKVAALVAAEKASPIFEAPPLKPANITFKPVGQSLSGFALKGMNFINEKYLKPARVGGPLNKPSSNEQWLTSKPELVDPGIEYRVGPTGRVVIRIYSRDGSYDKFFHGLSGNKASADIITSAIVNLDPNDYFINVDGQRWTEIRKSEFE